MIDRPPIPSDSLTRLIKLLEDESRRDQPNTVQFCSHLRVSVGGSGPVWIAYTPKEDHGSVAWHSDSPDFPPVRVYLD